ncbi:sulfurtransferase [Oricola cellulosilytica]|nr:rhodanese-like domain-containing protein [Oricola cellulosilytica]
MKSIGTFLAAGAVTLTSAAAYAAPQGWEPLLEPAELLQILEQNDDVRVIQISGEAAHPHIAGTVYSKYADWRGPAENPGALRDVDTFEKLVRSLGINADTPVVVVNEGKDQTDMGTAARVYWTLKSLGVEDLALLNGGLKAWVDAKLPTTTETTTVQPSDFDAQWSDQWRVSTTEVEQLVESGDARLIDARPNGFFEGNVWTIARPGTIRGAGNLTYDVWFDGDRMVGPGKAREIANSYGQEDAPVTVSFCNTGHWAAINWFALSELAGVEDTKLYAESMAEWTQTARPVDNKPGTVKYYWLSTKKWASDLL